MRVCIEVWAPVSRVWPGLAVDRVRFLKASIRVRTALAVENLLLGKQLALYGGRRRRRAPPRG